jgi:predicted nucleic acid-binding protein
MSDRFIDTNVFLYLLEDGFKAEIAEREISAGGLVSVQVFNEVLANCLRKAKMSWDEAGEFLSGLREIVEVRDLTEEVHDLGRALGARYGFSVYDAMIVAAALHNGCNTLLSEDMQHGLVVENFLRIDNPFHRA